MLISHEVPISLLEESKKFNDYDYCLLHLTYEYPEYKQYYINAAKSGRTVLLDNSVFELGEALTLDKLAEGVTELLPTEFIVPDAFNDVNKTISNFEAFIKDYYLETSCSKRIGVIQGSTIEDLIRCYEYMSASKAVDKIAIPFGSKAYDELCDSEDKLERLCVGRQLFIQHLVDTGIWNNNKPHHLLGCSYAREFSNRLYKKINIESVDTSNPVVAGIEHYSYGEAGLNRKSSVKLCELIDYELESIDVAFIEYNVSKFRKICS